MSTVELKPYTEEELQFTDISGLESWREYDFGNGKTYRIEQPVKVHVKRKPEGDSHRIIDIYGNRHYIPSGWLAFKFDGKWGVQPTNT